MRLRVACLWAIVILTTCITEPRDSLAHDGAPEAEGHADRKAFEEWVRSLSAAQREGVDFWAAERSKPNSRSCAATSSNENYVWGCKEAQKRLAIVDVRRKSEPEYRKGWNAPFTDASAASTRNGSAPQLESTFWKLQEQDHEVISPAFGLSLSQVQEAYPGLNCIGGDLCDLEGASAQFYCPVPGSCVHMTLIHDDVLITGYIAVLDGWNWSRLLESTANALGRATISSIQPHGSIKIRSDTWNWNSSIGEQISFSHYTGFNAFGVALNNFEIMFTLPK